MIPKDATHTDIYGNWWYITDMGAYCMYKTCSTWNRYPDYLPLPELEAIT